MMATRKESKAKQARVDALSRENEILLQEKEELEKDLSGVRAELKKERQRSDDERAAHKAFKRQAEATALGLSDSLTEQEERFQSEMDSLKQEITDQADSLSGRIHKLESQIAKASTDNNGLIKSLEEKVSAEKSEREREGYAAQSMKDELFRRLSSSQNVIDSLKLLLPKTTAAVNSKIDSNVRKQ